MIAEGVREIAVLILVFAPLDLYGEDRLTGWTVSAILAIAVALFVLGVRLERNRL